MAGIGAIIGIGIAFLALGEGIAQVKEAVIKANAPTEEKSAGVEFGIGDSIANEGLKKNFMGPIPTVHFYGISGNHLGESERNDRRFGEGNEGRSAFRSVKMREHPEYMRIHMPTTSKHEDICLSYMLITDAVDNSATTLLYAWNGSIGKFCGLPWYESDAFLPSQTRDFQPPCQWFTTDGSGGPKAMSFRLRELSDPDRDKLVGMGQEYTDKKETLCAAPARLQYWKTVTDKCIPKYTPKFPAKTENGTDINETQARFGHKLDCKPGEPWNNKELVFNPPPVIGLDGFGGTVSLIPNPDAIGVGSFGGVVSSIPDPNAIGVGSFGGVVGSIPVDQAGKPVPPPPVATTVTPPVATDAPGLVPGAFCGDDDPTCQFANLPINVPNGNGQTNGAPPPATVPGGGVGVQIVPPPGKGAAPAAKGNTVNPILEAAQRGPTLKSNGVVAAAAKNNGVAQPAAKSTVNPVLEAAQRGPVLKSNAVIAPAAKNNAAVRPVTLVTKTKGKGAAATGARIVANNAAAGKGANRVVAAPVGKDKTTANGKLAAPTAKAKATKARGTAPVAAAPARATTVRSAPLRARSVPLYRRGIVDGVPDKCVDHLTVSDHASHERSAEKLCESETSWGPDFVSLRGRKMCDMCTRVVYDLCDETEDGRNGGIKDECFSLSTRSLRSKMVKRGEEKSYRQVQEWKRV